ncbi:MAG: transcription antitermination factor NusB [Opitutales bacterium]|nr:transcription antitermination factor NusB [Opitutales bacterium]NRA26425.1 transcription antitermination factor NusB [Opitutales bacterium]
MDEEPPVKKPPQRRANRIAAVQFLYSWELNRPEILSDGLRLFFENLDESRPYYLFAEELVHGALDHLDSIDEIIKERTANWDFNRIAKVDLSILRLAIFELNHRLDIPPIVSINEAIELSKILSNTDSKRFINGILDQLKAKLNRPLRTAVQDDF